MVFWMEVLFAAAKVIDALIALVIMLGASAACRV
jgi:hypothetical protein